MFNKSIDKFNKWRNRLLPGRVFLFIASIIIGILAGLTAVLLKTSVHLVQGLLSSFFRERYNVHTLIFIPLIGLFLSTLYVQFFRKGNLARGIGNILVEISRNKGIIAKHKLYSQLISSFFTLGFGGSAGLEAPISVTGAAIGSHLAQLFKMQERERTLLLACGAAGGIAAIFNSPIAGVLFALEIILSNLSIPSFAPLLVSTASATVVSKLLYTGQPFKLITEGWQMNSIPYFVILGLLCAFLSVYMIRVYYRLRKIISKWKNPYIKAIAGGLTLGLILFIFPPLFGEGFNIVESLLNGSYFALIQTSIFTFENLWLLLLYAFLIMLFKVIATAVTVNTGGNGGMFGSSLFTGAILGFIFSKFINMTGFSSINEVNFIVLAMAGVLAGVIHAPLTAIFLIAEITGGYVLFIPLMIVVSLSYFVSIYFEPYSAYTKGIAEKGDFFIYDRDKLILENIILGNILETDFITLNINDSLESLIHAIEQSKRNMFPVVDDDNKLVGIVQLDDVREIIFDRQLYNLLLIKDVMTKPATVIDVKERVYDIVKKIDELNVWSLPVVQDGKYVGFISKSTILMHYRDLLVTQFQ